MLVAEREDPLGSPPDSEASIRILLTLCSHFGDLGANGYASAPVTEQCV